MKYYEAIQFEVGPEHDGWRLDTVLRQGYGLSRRLLVRLKKTEKGIMVNGERAWTNRIMKTGDRIELYMEMESLEQIIPEPLPLNILYEDEHLRRSLYRIGIREPFFRPVPVRSTVFLSENERWCDDRCRAPMGCHNA